MPLQTMTTGTKYSTGDFSGQKGSGMFNSLQIYGKKVPTLKAFLLLYFVILTV